MENILVEIMSNFITLTDEEKQDIAMAFPIKTFKRKDFLLEEGQRAKDSFLVVNGCIREYCIIDGEEHTNEFYTELQSILNIESISNNKPSQYNLECIEHSTVAILNAKKESQLYKKHPRFGEICRVEMEKMFGENRERYLKFKNSTPKERYLNLIKERPSLINKVPQYHLASYLGVKPETLSRIRKRISLNS